MPNLTIALEPVLTERARNYARDHKTSLNDLIRQQLQALVGKEQRGVGGRFVQLARDIAERSGTSPGESAAPLRERTVTWRREDLHDRGERAAQ